jgi:ribosomal protein S6--L-glutamate ligase
MPFFLKTDKGHEGEGVFVVTNRKNLETALARLEKAGSDAFISQKMIPCEGTAVRAVVLHKQIMAYWKRPGRDDEAIASISRGSRVDKKWKPKLLAQARSRARCICEVTRINLAAFDFVFNLSHPDPQPFILEINYYFGRKVLGGSLRYYRLLLKAVQEWLNEKGLDASCVKLV